MKKLLLILTLFFGMTLIGCESETPTKNENPVVDDGTTDDNGSNLLQLTIEELAMYDGTNGNEAYIAVDGVIYDVTNSNKWNDGTHNGFSAGQDLTEEINNISPHGTSVLDGIPIVGEIVE